MTDYPWQRDAASFAARKLAEGGGAPAEQPAATAAEVMRLATEFALVTSWPREEQARSAQMHETRLALERAVLAFEARAAEAERSAAYWESTAREFEARLQARVPEMTHLHGEPVADWVALLKTGMEYGARTPLEMRKRFLEHEQIRAVVRTVQAERDALQARLAVVERDRDLWHERHEDEMDIGTDFLNKMNAALARANAAESSLAAARGLLGRALYGTSQSLRDEIDTFLSAYPAPASAAGHEHPPQGGDTEQASAPSSLVGGTPGGSAVMRTPSATAVLDEAAGTQSCAQRHGTETARPGAGEGRTTSTGPSADAQSVSRAVPSTEGGPATPNLEAPKIGRGSLAGCNITCDACAAGIPFVDETQAQHVSAPGFCEQPTPCAHTEFVALMEQTEMKMVRVDARPSPPAPGGDGVVERAIEMGCVRCGSVAGSDPSWSWGGPYWLHRCFDVDPNAGRFEMTCRDPLCRSVHSAPPVAADKNTEEVGRQWNEIRKARDAALAEVAAMRLEVSKWRDRAFLGQGGPVMQAGYVEAMHAAEARAATAESRLAALSTQGAGVPVSDLRPIVEKAKTGSWTRDGIVAYVAALIEKHAPPEGGKETKA